MQAEVSPDAPLFEDFIVAGLARDAPDKPIVPKVLYNFKKDTGIKDDIGVKDVIEFCFPDLEDVNGPSDSFTFTLTKVEGTRIFGYCRHLIQKGQMPICLCVVSRRPWFTLFQEMLSIVQSNYDLARFVPAFVPSAHAATAKAGLLRIALGPRLRVRARRYLPRRPSGVAAHLHPGASDLEDLVRVGADAVHCGRARSTPAHPRG